MPVRSLGECLGENVTVLGYPLLPAWLLSDGRQAQQGLVTDATLYNNSFNILQMAAPRAAICLHLAMEGQLLGGCHACVPH